MRRSMPVLTLAVLVLLPWGSTRVLGQGKGAAWEQEKEREREIAALQGTWKMLRWEENGKVMSIDGLGLHWHVKGSKMLAEEKGKFIDEGKLEYLDPMRTPAPLDIHWAGRATDAQIYVRAGDYLILCGNRGGGPRPTQFKSGVPGGGSFLVVFKIER
jgi:uncharacterized protein (TIGR03067 family)